MRRTLFTRERAAGVVPARHRRGARLPEAEEPRVSDVHDRDVSPGAPARLREGGGGCFARGEALLTARALVLTGLLWCALPVDAGGAADVEPGEAQPTVVYLLRHAETDKESAVERKDPHLEERGRERAVSLARLLVDGGITTLYTSDFRRTRQTIGPLGYLLGLDPQVYDARDLPGIAEILRSRPGRHVVVGHSNTTPRLVELLGGEPGPPIDDATEFDRLYILVLDGTRTTTMRLRY
jgi:broad specificity phosphatase PhoE